MSSFVVGLVVWNIEFYMDLPKMLSGIILGFGFLISLINGMLYKIVPFLVWFHLTNQGHFNVPTTKSLIKETNAMMQLKLHFISFISFVIASLFDFAIFYKIGALFFVASNIVLFINLLHCITIYKKTLKS